eukprot:scaffold5508_cov104-Cylindrotheca_fusiformis.AAC.2
MTWQTFIEPVLHSTYVVCTAFIGMNHHASTCIVSTSVLIRRKALTPRIMNKLHSILLLLLASVVSGFAPLKSYSAPRTISTELKTAPTMSAIDYAGYATGQTDKFQGTGVFSGIKMEREPKEGDDKAPTPEKEEDKKELTPGK